MGLWSRLFGDEGRLKTTGHINGLFAHINSTIDSKEYTSRLKIVYSVAMIQLMGAALFILFLEILIVILMHAAGIDHLRTIVSLWISIPIIILFTLAIFIPPIWMIYYGAKNNWTGGLKK